MRTLFSIIFTVGVVISTVAQYKIQGRVTDPKGAAIEGAAVVEKSSRKGVTTNSDGKFELLVAKAGKATLQASFIGFEPAEVTVDVPNGSLVTIKMQESAYTMDELLVSATWLGENAPYAHTTIEQKQLKKLNVAADMPMMLEGTPGLVATSENGTGFGYSNFRIRGTDITRINVTVNGIPLNDAESQGVFWVNMPDLASSVSAVQVQRGVGSSTNGAAAFGATVNFKTHEQEKEAYGEVQSMVGSFNTFRNTLLAGTGLLKNGFNFDVRYSKLNSDGYIKNGFTDHTAYSFSGSWQNGTTMIKALAMLGEEHTGITWWGVPDYMVETDRRFNPAGIYTDANGNEQYFTDQTDNYWQNHYHLLFAHRFNDYVSLNGALFLTTGEGYYQQYKENDKLSKYGLEPFVLGVDTIKKSDIIRQKWLDNIFYGYNFSFNYQKERLSAVVGTSWNKYQGDHFGLVKWMDNNLGLDHDFRWYLNNSIKTDFNVFAKAEVELTEQLSLFGDVQYRSIGYRLQGPDDDLQAVDQEHTWNFVNPKAGFSYALGSGNLYGSFAVANREPARADLKDATKYGASRFPKPERLFDYELGYLHKQQGFTAGINLYYMNYRDQLVNTGELNSVGYPIMTNVDKSYRTGVEFVGAAIAGKFFRFDANATLSQNKISGTFTQYIDSYDNTTNWEWTGQQSREYSNTTISFSPSITAYGKVTFMPFDGFEWFIDAKHVGKQYLDNTQRDDRSLDAYSFVNTGVAYSLVNRFAKNITLQLNVNNVLGSEYSNNGWVYPYYFEQEGVEGRDLSVFPQATRNVAAKVIIRF